MVSVGPSDATTEFYCLFVGRERDAFNNDNWRAFVQAKQFARFVICNAGGQIFLDGDNMDAVMGPDKLVERRRVSINSVKFWKPLFRKKRNLKDKWIAFNGSQSFDPDNRFRG
jgi:hypothetical protein